MLSTLQVWLHVHCTAGLPVCTYYMSHLDILMTYPDAGRNRTGAGAGTTGQTGRRPNYGTGASSGSSSQGGFPVTGSGVSAAPQGRDSASDSAGYGSSGRSQSAGQGYDAQAQGYAGGQGYTGTDSNRSTGQPDYTGTGANRGGPQTSQTGYGGQSTGVGGSGSGGENRAGPTGGNYGGPQTDQSTYGTGAGTGSRNY